LAHIQLDPEGLSHHTQDYLQLLQTEAAVLVRGVKLVLHTLPDHGAAQSLLEKLQTWVQELESHSAHAQSERWWQERDVHGLLASACPVALGHILVFQEEAIEQWVDWIGYSFFSKKQILLQFLQQSIVEEGVYTAIAEKKLIARPDADVTNEFRKVLILWSTSAAIRLVLKVKRESKDLSLSSQDVVHLLDTLSSQQVSPFIEELHARTSHLSALLQDACIHTYVA
jgi:hypothetical protein